MDHLDLTQIPQGGFRTLEDIMEECLDSLLPPLPNESQCPTCGYFHSEHPAVIEWVSRHPGITAEEIGCRYRE